MDLYAKPISKGEGPESYTVHLPFDLSRVGRLQTRESSENVVSASIRCGDREGMITRRDDRYILRIPGFKEESEAEQFAAKASIALFLASIKERVPIIFHSNITPIDTSAANRPFREYYLPQAPKPWERREDGTYTDGGVIPRLTYVIPEHKRIVEFPFGWGTRLHILHTDTVSNLFTIAEKCQADMITKNDRVGLAFTLYSDAWTHDDATLTFITLVEVLELLTEEDAKIPERSLEVLKGAIEFVKSKMNKCAKGKPMEDAEQYAELTRLFNRVSNLAQESINQKVCNLVYESLYSPKCRIADVPEMTRHDSDKTVKDIYNIRSELVHSGEVGQEKEKTGRDRFNESFAHLQEIVPMVLLSEISKSLKPHESPFSVNLLTREI